MSLDVASLAGVQIAAQEQSLAAYQIGEQLGGDNLTTYPKIDEVFNQLASGTVSYAAADAIVGSFLAVKKQNIRCDGVFGEAQGVYMGVAADKQNLVGKLTDVLRALRDDGSMQVIVSKWIGPMSAEAVLAIDAIVVQPGSGASTTTTPTGESTSGAADSTPPAGSSDSSTGTGTSTSG
jgi:ABC-type amino acid transport substrate-binding protein